ncbi:MAG: 5'-nucleotidase C-terminal domain-containing protein [Gemmatimonadota bacterium]|nr:5'-nucleotidase C-terminal domain-containing protein [Gemmatimonadota bacterium]
MYRVVLSFLLAAPGLAAQAAAAAGADSRELVVASTTDVHGRLRGWDYYAGREDGNRGLTRAATIVDSLRATSPGRVLLIDAGDLLQGTPLTFIAARRFPSRAHPVIAAMNAMRYDAAAIGNHEFNYGVPLLNHAIAQAHFPFLAANAMTPAGRHAYTPWVIVRRAGIRVGIIGATTPGSVIWDRDNLRGRLVIRDIVPAVGLAVGEARKAGADVIVVTVHSGLDEPASYDTVSSGVPSENVAARLAREVPGIDLIIYGHSHKEIAEKVIGTTLLMQPKNWATSVAVAHLRLVRAGRGWRVAERRGELVQAKSHAESAALLAATEGAHERTVAYVATRIGTTPVAWRADSARVADTPLMDFIGEVERRTAGSDLASTAAFSLDASLSAGPITVAEIAKLYPYENTLKAVRLTGRQLRDYLEFSARYFGTAGTDEPAVSPQIPGYNFDIITGADYTIDLSRPAGSRIARLQVKGKAVADSDVFTMALNNYRQSGGGGYAMLRGAPVVYDKQTEIRQLLIDEVARRQTLRPDDYFTRSWTLEPAEAAARAYQAMHRMPGEGGDTAVAGRGAPSRLRIIATNDFHGALEPRPDAGGVMRGGAAYMASAIEAAERSCTPPCETILLDAGDMFQGTPSSNLAFGRPVVELYNRLGYAAAALGNHEFDWGTDTLRALMRRARYDILAANVRYADGRDVEWIPNDTIVRRGAITIGIIGVADVQTPRTTLASNVAGLRFDDPAPIVDSITRVMRGRGAQAVIVIAHEGAYCDRDGATNCRGEIVDLANALTEPVDAIVSGHTHSFVDAVIHGTPVVQARRSGQAIDILDLDLGPGQRAVLAHPAMVRDIVSDSLAPSPGVDSLVRRAVAAVAERMNRPVATIARPMPKKGEQYALGDLIADAQRWAIRSDVAVMNNGGIRAGLGAGSATYGTLFEIQPFANVLSRLTVTGSQLRSYLEQLVGGTGEPRSHVSGLIVTYDQKLPVGSRILSAVLADGSALSPTVSYTVGMNEFMVSTGEGVALARSAQRVETTNVADLDALTGYLSSRPQPVTPPDTARLIVRAP